MPYQNLDDLGIGNSIEEQRKLKFAEAVVAGWIRIEKSSDHKANLNNRTHRPHERVNRPLSFD